LIYKPIVLSLIKFFLPSDIYPYSHIVAAKETVIKEPIEVYNMIGEILSTVTS